MPLVLIMNDIQKEVATFWLLTRKLIVFLKQKRTI